jgi:hypothetical protein
MVNDVSVPTALGERIAVSNDLPHGVRGANGCANQPHVIPR